MKLLALTLALAACLAAAGCDGDSEVSATGAQTCTINGQPCTNRQ